MERWQSWLNALASKASNGLNPFVGSNPTLSASFMAHFQADYFELHILEGRGAVLVTKRLDPQ